ncbi:MAG: MoaD/ThiS family protein [Promethearchaeota archaeon]
MEKLSDLIQTGDMQTYTVQKTKKVSDLLKELGLEGKYFAILIDGKKANVGDTISEGSEIVILPKIAGGA